MLLNKVMYYFIAILKNELAKRQLKNPKYSIRSFARDIEIDSSSLTSILNGKRAFPIKQAQILFDKLKLTEVQRYNFLESLTTFQTRKKVSKKLTSPDLIEPSNPLLREVISNWEYFAFLSLIQTDNIQWDNNWMAKRLGIPTECLQKVISTLLELNLIERTEKSTYFRTKKRLITTQDEHSEALVEAHKQELALVVKNMEDESIPLLMQDFSSITIPTNVENIKSVKKLIREFREKVEKSLETGSKTEVYQLSVQLSPLTKRMT